MSNHKKGLDGTQNKSINSSVEKFDKSNNQAEDKNIPFLNIDPIQSQRMYLNSLPRDKRMSPQLVNAEGFSDIAPDLGYKGPDFAIFEMTDNSIDGGADRIDIVLDVPGKRSQKAEIQNIGIIDNGTGIIPEMLPHAMCFADGTNRDNPTGLGKFGMGGPGAARMLTDDYEIYSKTKEGECYSVSFSQSKVRAGEWTDKQGRTIVPPAVKKELPGFIQNYLDENHIVFEQGTILVLKNIPRLENGYKTLRSCQQKLIRRLGETYPNHLDRVDMFVDGKEVPLIDVTFLNSKGLYHDIGNGVFAEARGSQRIAVTVNGKKGYIDLTYAYFPRGFSRTGASQNERFGIMKENNCFIDVFRCGRQITKITRLSFPCGLRKSLVNNDRNWSATLNFSPELDPLFKVSFNKQRISATAKLWQILEENDVHLALKGLWQEVNKAQSAARAEKENGSEETRESELTMSEAAPIIKGSESEERAKERQKNLESEVKRRAKESGRKAEEVRPEVIAESSQKPYKVVFEHKDQAPHYWMNVEGVQTQLILNTAHPFYSMVYDAPGSTKLFKTQIELMLYSKGLGEIESTGQRALFCEHERYQWSQRLSVVLSVHDSMAPLEESYEATEALSESEQSEYKKAS